MLTLAAPALWLRLGSSDAGNNPTSFTPAAPTICSPKASAPASTARSASSSSSARHGDNAALATLRSAAARTPTSSPSHRHGSARRGNVGRDQRISTLLAAEQRDDRASSSTYAATSSRHWSGVPGRPSTSAARPRPSSTSPASSPPSSGCSSPSSSRLSALLLMVVFRSLLIPLQAAVMNLLSIGAALGVLVAVFQFGWFPGISQARSRPSCRC